MLTKEKIETKALKEVAGGEAPLWGGGFVEGATWATEQAAIEITDLYKSVGQLKFRVDGDAILLQAANQTIQKERAQIAELEAVNSEQAGKIVDLQTRRDEHLRTIADLMACLEVVQVYIKKLMGDYDNREPQESTDANMEKIKSLGLNIKKHKK